MNLARAKDMILGLWLLYTIMFIMCINPTFLLALWAHENARQRVKQLLNARADLGGLRR